MGVIIYFNAFWRFRQSKGFRHTFQQLGLRRRLRHLPPASFARICDGMFNQRTLLTPLRNQNFDAVP